jgi:hypothetical protein
MRLEGRRRGRLRAQLRKAGRQSVSRNNIGPRPKCTVDYISPARLVPRL